MNGRSVLEILLVLKDQASGAFDKAKGKVQGFAQGLKKVSTAALGAAAALFAVGKTVGVLIDQAVAFERSQTALAAYTGSAEAAAEATTAVQQAAGNALSAVDATATATRLFSMGLASSSEEAAKLTEVAVTLGATMGKGPQAAIEEFSLMLANQSIPRLDTFGISGAKVRERMEELASQGIAPADRQTRFLIATLEEAEGKLGLLEDAGFQAANSIERMKARIEDGKLAVATWLSDGLLPWVDGITAVVDAHKEHDFWLNETSQGIESQIERLGGLIAIAQPAARAVLEKQVADLEAKNAAIEHADAIQAETDRLQGLADMYGVGQSAAEGAAEANRDVVASLGEVTAATLAADAMANLNAAFAEGSIDQDEYRTLFYDISTKMAGMDGETATAQLALMDLNQEFANTGDISSYVEKAEALGRAIGALESKKIEVEVLYRYGGYQDLDFQHGGQIRVFGAPGNDQIPFGPSNVSSGETITFTPPGMTAPGGRGGGGGRGGVNFFGPVNINNREDEDIFFERLRRMNA